MHVRGPYGSEQDQGETEAARRSRRAWTELLMFSKTCLPAPPGGRAKEKRNRNLVANRLSRWAEGDQQCRPPRLRGAGMPSGPRSRRNSITTMERDRSVQEWEPMYRHGPAPDTSPPSRCGRPWKSPPREGQQEPCMVAVGSESYRMVTEHHERQADPSDASMYI